ncbi:hypothetical protein EGR_04190 [Echinococcus granulosus]|uniref:Uncharacterized protein n=1 Tax=Echinococcus granulosus TaxID=6210 RepID=W6V4B2_ECHGR|nr:hypothetical protein EGR_04190 [Echinococcus granulosus]EUB60944.1 hypothetical protein EGR_04190 [Echinococcus granulosus]
MQFIRPITAYHPSAEIKTSSVRSFSPSFATNLSSQDFPEDERIQYQGRMYILNISIKQIIINTPIIDPEYFTEDQRRHNTRAEYAKEQCLCNLSLRDNSPIKNRYFEVTTLLTTMLKVELSIGNFYLTRDKNGNKVFVISELKIVNISPHLHPKRHSSMQTEENSLRKENVGFCQKKSFEISKLVTLTIRPRICLLTESTVQVGAVTEAVSTQTLDVRERKNKDLLVHANFQNYEPIPESKKLQLLEILQSNQPCEHIKGKSTKQSQPAGPRTFGYGDCQSSASNTVNFEDQVGEKRCKETSILMAAFEEELNRITDSIKVCHNSGCSPNKRRRLDTRCNPPKADQHVFTDEMLQNATSELIKELERVRMGNIRRNEIPLSSSAETTNRPMLKSCLPKAEHDCVLADGQTKHQVDLSSTSMCLKSQIKTDSRKTVEEVDNQKTQQSNQELEKFFGYSPSCSEVLDRKIVGAHVIFPIDVFKTCAEYYQWRSIATTSGIFGGGQIMTEIIDVKVTFETRKGVLTLAQIPSLEVMKAVALRCYVQGGENPTLKLATRSYSFSEPKHEMKPVFSNFYCFPKDNLI